MTLLIPIVQHGAQPAGSNAAAAGLWAALGGLVVAVLFLSAVVWQQSRHAALPSPALAQPVAPPAPLPIQALPVPLVAPQPKAPEGKRVVRPESAATHAAPAGLPPLAFNLPGTERQARPPLPPPSGQGEAQGVYATAKACPNCGWVESVDLRSEGGLPPGAMAAAGAVLGAQAAGRKVGTSLSSAGTASTGSSTSSASHTGAGAVAAAVGAVAGANAVSGGRAGTGAGPRTVYEMRIRMEDGSLRVVEQAEPLPLGAAVVMEAGMARLAGARSAPAPTGGKVYGTD